MREISSTISFVNPRSERKMETRGTVERRRQLCRNVYNSDHYLGARIYCCLFCCEENEIKTVKKDCIRTAVSRIYAVFFFIYTGYTGCFRCVNVSCLDM